LWGDGVNHPGLESPSANHMRERDAGDLWGRGFQGGGLTQGLLGGKDPDQGQSEGWERDYPGKGGIAVLRALRYLTIGKRKWRHSSDESYLAGRDNMPGLLKIEKDRSRLPIRPSKTIKLWGSNFLQRRIAHRHGMGNGDVRPRLCAEGDCGKEWSQNSSKKLVREGGTMEVGPDQRARMAQQENGTGSKLKDSGEKTSARWSKRQNEKKQGLG